MNVYTVTVKPYVHEDLDWEANKNMQEKCITEGFVSVGWGGTGDLSAKENQHEISDVIYETHKQYYSNNDFNIRRKLAVGVSALWRISHEMKEGDYVFMSYANKVRMGKVCGKYYYDKTDADWGYNAHRIKVRWFDKKFERANLIEEIQNGISNRQIIVRITKGWNPARDEEIRKYVEGLVSICNNKEGNNKASLIDVSLTARISVNDRIVTVSGLPNTIDAQSIELICSELKKAYSGSEVGMV